MARSVTWKEDGIVSIKLRDDLFTLGQMLKFPYMRFFKLKSDEGRWHAIDLGNVEPLFCVQVGRVVLQELVAAKVKDRSVLPDRAPLEKLWIRPHINYTPPPVFKGGDLIRVDPGVDDTRAPVVKANLSFPKDREDIERYELTNMWGAQDLGERLRHFFDTGVDWNPLKAQGFGLAPRPS